ncbi:hypothetical protein [uncultured Pelagimonas sp.]|uniref:hypothetical protein n=1 Tax=uncultured Pelagimonas sp. TaxID=1618102 RepID=UPI002629E5DD|nr:hypothetical protein [uncultured Pelagimonas sp.]
MGSGKGGSAPSAPNPYDTAQAQANINRLNTYTPYGNSVYGHVGSNGEFVAGQGGRDSQSAVSLIESPFQQQLREGQEEGALGLQSALLGGGINLPDRATPQGTDAIAQEFYDNNVGLISRDFERDQMRTEGRLQNRGIPIGAEAFDDGMRPVREAQTNALTGLAAQAQQYAGNEQSRRYGLDRTSRNDALGEYMTAISGEQFSPSPLINLPNTQGIDLAGMINNNYQAEMQQYSMDQQNRMQNIGMIGGLLGGFL